MRRACLLVAMSLLACSQRSARPTADASARSLEGMGKTMLDPTRLEIMQPAAIVAKLALRPDAIVADLGAGPGAFTHELARAVPRGRVIATDINAAYLDRIAKDATRDGERNVETRLVGREDSGLADAEVDEIFLCQVDHYLRDRRDYFARLAPKLRASGRIVVVNYSREERAVEAVAATLGWCEDARWEPVAGFFGQAYRVGP